ncbi:MAG: MAPEG family protein [Litoreibacter sp.]
MTHELTILTLAALLQAVQFAAYSIAANLQVGPKVAMGPRDNPPAISGIAGRLKRAMENHFEALIFFTIAAVVITLSDQSTAVTKLAATSYLIARILYIPAYAFGLTPWRTVVWVWGFASTITMLVAALI